jgi:hypothetical protein
MSWRSRGFDGSPNWTYDLKGLYLLEHDDKFEVDEL